MASRHSVERTGMLGVLGKFLELVRMDKIDKHSISIVENIDRLSRKSP